MRENKDCSFRLSSGQRQRIHVIGTSGSGKSTLARRLAQRLNSSYIELDALHWLPNWQEEANDCFREKLKDRLSCSAWVLDGNYFSKSVDIQWAVQGGATAVVWCDYSFSLTMVRAIKRACVRAWTQQEVWPGTANRESFRRSFFSHESIVLWTMHSFWSNRSRYSKIIAENQFPHLKFIRLRSRKQTETFMSQF
ncbi:MAG: AAA family ATPase [Planctomycetota bacterium]